MAHSYQMLAHSGAELHRTTGDRVAQGTRLRVPVNTSTSTSTRQSAFGQSERLLGYSAGPYKHCSVTVPDDTPLGANASAMPNTGVRNENTNSTYTLGEAWTTKIYR